MLAKTLVFGYKLHVTITTNARAFGKQVSSFVTFIVLLNGFHSSAFIYLPVSVCVCLYSYPIVLLRNVKRISSFVCGISDICLVGVL